MAVIAVSTDANAVIINTATSGSPFFSSSRTSIPLISGSITSSSSMTRMVSALMVSSLGRFPEATVGGQGHLEGGALAGRAFHEDRAAVLLQDPVRHRKA